MFDLVQLSRCLYYSSPNYIINYYIYDKGYIINNCYQNYYTDYEGLEIIASKSRKQRVKEIMKDINYWKSSKLLTKSSIKFATKKWFNYLK